MTRTSIRLVPLLAGALALAACADHPSKPQTTTRTTVTSPTSGTTTAKPRTATTSVTTAPSPRTGTRASTKEAPLPDSTGIAACDEYLASYKSCHLAAGVFARDQIDSRYDMM